MANSTLSQSLTRSPSPPPAQSRPRPPTGASAAPEGSQRTGTTLPATPTNSSDSSSGDYEGPHTTPLRPGGRTNDNAVKPVEDVQARPYIVLTIEGKMYELGLAEMFADYIPGTDPTQAQLDSLHYDPSVGNPGPESSKYPLIVSLPNRRYQ